MVCLRHFAASCGKFQGKGASDRRCRNTQNSWSQPLRCFLLQRCRSHCTSQTQTPPTRLWPALRPAVRKRRQKRRCPPVRPVPQPQPVCRSRSRKRSRTHPRKKRTAAQRAGTQVRPRPKQPLRRRLRATPLLRSPQRIRRLRRRLRVTPLLRSPLHIRQRRPTRHRPRIRPLRLMRRPLRLRRRPRLAARIQRRPRMQRSMRMCGGSRTCKNAAAKNCIRPQAVHIVNIWNTPWKNGIWR